ncbi:MAG: molybdopterin-dependent oxidoreductase [Clostridia bacterium]|nr:molybdopterin-dependent oxidoreductase [Clostridia bacterium]
MKQSKNTLKLLSGAVGAVTLLGGSAVADYAQTQESGIIVESRAQESYKQVANIQGEFSFDQNVLTPTDEVFNIFGTAVTGICAKPGFAFDRTDRENYFINIKGRIKHSYSLSLDDLMQRNAERRVMTCSCATSPAIANARVTGVALSDVIELSQIEPDANTITVRSQDGYGLSMPLSYALEKDGMLVWKINDTTLTDATGGPVQLWMPDTVARYFTRQVFEIELSSEENEPQIAQADADYRAKVAFVNRVGSDSFDIGTQMTFEGYADDCGQAIAAVEFSMDGGVTWTSCSTQGASSSRWVYWNFSWIPDTVGVYKLEARARCADGSVSPLAANVVFSVTEGSSASV